MFLSYSLRNLWVRRASAISAAAGVAVVVFLLACVQMFVGGIRKASMGSRGDEGRVVILARGAQVEFASALGEADVAILKTAPGIAAGADGTPLLAPELVSVVLVPANDGRLLNVQVRGTTPASWTIRSALRVVEGRAPAPGSDEVAIGRALSGRLSGAHVGGTVELRAGHPARIVGVFDAADSGLGSEIWADLDVLRGQLGRAGVISSIRARLRSPDQLPTLRAATASDPRLAVEVTSEADFNEQMAAGSTKLVGALGTLVGVFGAIAAIFGALVALNGSVAHREREIGTLRALGFSRARILSCLLTEAIALAAAGGIVGALAAIALGRLELTTTSFSSFSLTVIRFDANGRTIGLALAVSGMVGVLGGIVPAVAAARIAPAAALKRV